MKISGNLIFDEAKQKLFFISDSLLLIFMLLADGVFFITCVKKISQMHLLFSRFFFAIDKLAFFFTVFWLSNREKMETIFELVQIKKRYIVNALTLEV